MNLQGIVAVSGKPGLWKALSQNKTGFILESLDEKKTKMVANISTAKLAALDEITVFGNEDDIKLKDIFEKIKTAASIPDAKSDGNKLRVFFREVAPGHDEEKVYSSDIKKIINWFGVLKDQPLFNEADPGVTEAPEAVAGPAPVAEEKPVPDDVEERTKAKKKPAAKKQPAK